MDGEHKQTEEPERRQDEHLNGEQDEFRSKAHKTEDDEMSFASRGADSIVNTEKDEDPTTHEVKYTTEIASLDQEGGKSLLTNASPQLAQDVRAAFAAVPRVKPSWTDRHMKILVVGESGLGKTTFIQNLLGPYAQQPDLAVNGVTGPEALKTFQDAPEKMATLVEVQDNNSLTHFHYSVQDSPGYNTLETTKEPILEHIRKQSAIYLTDEHEIQRNNPGGKLDDSRVDVALFFIAPHRLRPLDIEFITDLAELVPVVPVIAKADSMTLEELRQFRKHIRSQLEQAGKHARRDLLHAFSEDALDAAGARRECPPFAVIASTTMDLSVGKFWPVRQYPWGTCEALSSTHSDVGALKRLLFEDGYEELKSETNKRYFTYRSEQLLDDPSLPLTGKRGHVAEHLYKAGPKSNNSKIDAIKGTLTHGAKKGLKYVVGGAVFYFAVSLALGGRDRVKHDLEVLKDESGKAARVTGRKAQEAGSVVADKAQDAGAVLADKAQDVGGKAADKAGDLAVSAKEKSKELGSKAADKAGEVKETVQEKFMSEEALEEKRKAEARKKRWGPFGIFPKGN
ncbi:hypothetical protein CVIRNUC_009511 [Coccomyxa viridis]|uniref:Septin-type G domain-containing protein n=1 Tax=Coccomyxa viridis TaxID=1274662 RepID=A0AAV1IK68_9CHLO|nr:hypothetical protein CVIRNUC_009511 [Coccomyxa viridis]